MRTAAPGRRFRSPNPYRVPRPAVISFSGGRSSAYLLKRIVDAYDGRLPDNVHIVFCNTGMEREETLNFVDICSRTWRVPVTWLEYDWDAPHRTRIVDHATAARNGEPYAALIDRKGFVPSISIRYCSGFLKRDRIESFARHRLGLKRWHSVIGLRADEPRRVWRMRARNCGSRTGASAVLPLADAGVREADVLDWWIEREAKVADRKGPDGRACDSMKRFRLGETYAELKAAALADRDLFDEAAAADDSGDSDSLDCSCTD